MRSIYIRAIKKILTQKNCAAAIVLHLADLACVTDSALFTMESIDDIT